MKIQVCIENTTRLPEITAEHGLSLYIETGAHKILFDMGQTDTFAENATRMHVDLSAVTFAVLSHGHYDHAGGLAHFLEVNKTAPVYINEHAFGKHVHKDGSEVGIDPSFATHPRVILTKDFTEICAGITLQTCNTRKPIYPINAENMFVETNGTRISETFQHEQYLCIEENDKKIVFSGCSHKGIMNISSWFSPDYLIGGFHMRNIDPSGTGKSTLQDAARVLLQNDTIYYTGHCTGMLQYQIMKQEMHGRIQYISAGQTVYIQC